MKLLILSEENSLLLLMQRFFKKEGYKTEVVARFREAERKLINYEYDCMIISWSLPDGNTSLVRALRQTNKQLGIIFVSAKDVVEDRVVGLGAGADDFMVQPIHLPELNARLKSIMRRKNNNFSSVLTFDELTVKLEAREVSISEVPVKLTRKEFDILEYLIRNKNRVITKERLAEYLWGEKMEDADSYDFIYAHLKNLRRKLNDKAGRDLIKTIYGIGYKFIAE